ncbi:MAG: hypothetical protein V4568_01635 [Pseudomonadota bacterium]
MRTSHDFLNKDQRGIALLEGLIALLIFSIAIIALMGLQAAALNNASEAKFRADASFLANQIVGHIWSDRDNVGSYAYNGVAATSCPSGTNPTVCGWLAGIRDVLPDAANQTQTVAIAGTGAAGVNQVTVTVGWKSPRGAAHNFVIVTQIGG